MSSLVRKIVREKAENQDGAETFDSIEAQDSIEAEDETTISDTAEIETATNDIDETEIVGSDMTEPDTDNSDNIEAENTSDDAEVGTGKSKYKESESKMADHNLKILTQVNEKIDNEKVTYAIPETPQNNLETTDVLTALNNGEDGDADLFIYRNKNKLIYDHKSRTWYVWKNKRWNPDQINQHLVSFDPVIDIYANEIKNQNAIHLQAVKNGTTDSQNKAEKIKKSLSGRIKQLRQLNRRKNILKLASSGENSLGMSGDEWDSQVDVLPCENGICNLKSGEFREYIPEDYFKTIAPVKFLGLEIAAPVFAKFLSTSFNNNKELIAFVQRLLGSAISGEVIEHCISIFWGENGRNGKGTLLEIIKAVLGPLASPIQVEMLLKQKYSKSSSAASPDILHLKGKRIVWASESEKDKHLNVSTIKLVTGGDSLIARGLYEKTYTEFTPTHSIFLITNHRPHIPANENALWKRIFLIPFELSFVDNPKFPYERKKDPHLKEKLLKEKSGILAWLLRGYHQYQREGLNPPEIVFQQIDQYKEDEDTIHGFIKECCEIKEDSIASSTDLYKAYIEYCKNNNLCQESHTKFGTIISESFKKGVQQGKTIYKGIFLQISC